MSYCDTCLACAEQLAASLAFAASLRCHDCRACRALLQAVLVEQAHAEAAPGAVLQLPARPVELDRAA